MTHKRYDADTPSRYIITVRGRVGQEWSVWFGDMTITTEIRDGVPHSTFGGVLADQSALHGVLARIRDMNLVLETVIRQTLNEDSPQQ